MGIGVAGFLGAPASAAPVTPDPGQPPNGVSAPGYRSENPITPWYSPVQVPTPIVTGGDEASRMVVYRAYPYLATWLHNAIGRQPVELQGAARVTFVNPVNGKTVVINPNGHCDFTNGHHVGAGRALHPIVIDAGGFAVTIKPRLHRLT